MRILVIGYALPDPEIDNYNPFTAPNYSDYDALVIDPLSITREARNLVEGTQEYIAFDERPVINGPTSATAVSGADQLKRRAAETRRLLEYGGTVIVAPSSPSYHRLWEQWLGKRPGWGCGSHASDPSLVTLELPATIGGAT